MVSIKKIAELSGVSVSTVSRVINNHPYVSDEKRERVARIIEESNYIPNQFAINLSKGKSGMIGLVLPYNKNSCYDEILKGALEEASKVQRRIVLLPTFFNQKIEESHFSLLKNKVLDGIIVTSRTSDSSFVSELAKYGEVLVTEDNKDKEIRAIYPDRRKVYDEVFRYLFNEKKDFKKIVCTVSRSSKLSASTRLKQEIYQSVFQSDHLPFSEGIFTFEDGYHFAKKFFGNMIDPVAFYVNGDEVAAGVIEASKEFGFKHKTDFLVIGEDHLPYSQILNFSTIDYHLEEIGRKAVKALVNKEAFKIESIDPSFILRE